MVVGYILIGTIAGLFAFSVALLSGTSFWIATSFYVLTGAAVAILLPAATLVASIIGGRHGASGHRNPAENSQAVNVAASLRGAIVEKPMKILAVDDDPFILELIPMISAKAGFSEVTPAASGEQALRLLADRAMFFDCLLIDITMPGMDGIELCRRIRQIPRYCQTPILMLTAMRNVKNMGEAFSAGATDYVIKPFDVEELGKRLKLTQETIYVNQDTNPGEQQRVECRLEPLPGHRFELPERVRSEANGRLVDHAVLSNYLTQLLRKDVAEAQVFAISIDWIDPDQTRFSPQKIVSLLKEVAAAAVDCFGADRTVMAYTRNATLLVITNTVSTFSAIKIESVIERRLQSVFSDDVTGDATGIGVSVGGPVQPQDAKARRANTAFESVIALAKSRALDKQGRPDASLFGR